MTDEKPPDPALDTFSARLIRREARRRAALDLATTTPIGLESAMERISAEVTADAAEAKALDEAQRARERAAALDPQMGRPPGSRARPPV